MSRIHEALQPFARFAGAQFRSACRPFALLLLAALLPLGAAQPPDRIWQGGVRGAAAAGTSLKVLSWNIERGLQLPAIASALEGYSASLVLLQEVDLNARRTGRKNIAGELALRLGMAYLFAAEFEELGQGNRAEPAYHGQAILTSLPVSSPRIIRFRRQAGYWAPRWYLPNWAVFQRREGGRLALVAEVEIGGRRLVVYNVHLESRDSGQGRLEQMQEVLADAGRYPAGTPVLIAGDLNTREPSPPAIAALLQAGFRKAAGGQATTAYGKALDWIFIRGPVAFANGAIHSGQRGSDHMPLTADIQVDSP